MALIQKWKDAHYQTKKWIIVLAIALTVALGVGGYYSVRAIVNYDPYAKYTQIRKGLEGKSVRTFF